jgi:hypothetical protein
MDYNMNDRLTALELARRYDNKDTRVIIELLNMTNQMLSDVPNIACNHGETHEVLLRDSYPKAEVHGFNMGVGAASTQTRTVMEGLMKMSIYSVVDESLARAAGNAEQVYGDEAKAFLMGMGVQQAELLIYGSKKKNPYEIDGLFTRRGKGSKHCINFWKDYLNKQTAAPADVTSIYICAAGSNLFHLLHSKNLGEVGVKRENRGVQDWDMQSAGKKIPCHVDFFTAQFGLAVENPDSVWRIANVPTTGLGAADRAVLIDCVLHVQKLLPQITTTACLYGNLSVIELIEKAAREIQVAVHPDKDPWGNPVDTVNGMRARRMDVIKTGASEQVA